MGWVYAWAFTAVINGWEKRRFWCFWLFWSPEDIDKLERGQRKAQRMTKRLKTMQHHESLRGFDGFNLPKPGLRGDVTTVCKSLQED